MLAVAILSSGCARRISSNTYHADHVGEASFSYQGTVVSVRKVTVKEAERMQDNTTGMVAGGLGGAVLGSTIGKGTGQGVAAIGGGLLGATAGAFLQDYLGTQDGIEYVVRLTNGQIMTVVQAPDNPLSVGQRVLVIVGDAGRSRVVPDNSGYQGVQQVRSQAQTNIIKHKTF